MLSTHKSFGHDALTANGMINIRHYLWCSKVGRLTCMTCPPSLLPLF